MKLRITPVKTTEEWYEGMGIIATLEVDYKSLGTSFSSRVVIHEPDQLEEIQARIEAVAFTIREFRMKNFPESTEIE